MKSKKNIAIVVALLIVVGICYAPAISSRLKLRNALHLGMSKSDVNEIFGHGGSGHTPKEYIRSQSNVNSLSYFIMVLDDGTLLEKCDLKIKVRDGGKLLIEKLDSDGSFVAFDDIKDLTY